jgi:hypothetical protein
MGQVAQQLKVLADEDGIAILFPSDGTKTGATAGPIQVTDLRGNYQLNHLATTILGLHSRKPSNPRDPLSAAEALAGLEGRKEGQPDAEAILRTMPAWWIRWAGSEEALRFGPRPIALNCTGNRQGDTSDLFLAFVRGACAFMEGDPAEHADRQSMPNTSERQHGKGRVEVGHSMTPQLDTDRIREEL